MTLNEFRLLNTETRYVLWLSKAIEVAYYDKEDHYYVLYQLEDFYVEMRIHKEFPGNMRMMAFIDECKLEPYLQRIDISELAA